MLVLFWPIIIVVTILLYGLIIIFLPFDQTLSSVFLFALISFWSRLPGVGMPSPMYVLYFTDLVDFFSLIVAVNIGGFYGAVFSVFLNLTSRACGIFPSWLGVAKDTIAQFVVCLIIPYVYIITGQDIFMTMIWYSILRVLMFFPMRLLPVETSFPQFLVTMFAGGAAVLAINAAYARLFGEYLNSLLKAGAQFNWLLFLFATVIILIMKIYFFGHSKSKRMSFSLRLFRGALRGIRKSKRRGEIRRGGIRKSIKKTRNDIDEDINIHDRFTRDAK